MENTWQNTTGLAGVAAGEGDPGARLGRELYGQELRWFLTVKLVEAGEPMCVRDLVTAMRDAGFTVAGRASKVISDSLRWEIGRRRVLRLGRGVYQASTRIPRTTMRRLRRRVAEFLERQPAPVRTQPLRPPRPLVSPEGPKHLRRRRFTTANMHRHITQPAPQWQGPSNGGAPPADGASTFGPERAAQGQRNGGTPPADGASTFGPEPAAHVQSNGGTLTTAGASTFGLEPAAQGQRNGGTLMTAGGSTFWPDPDATRCGWACRACRSDLPRTNPASCGPVGAVPLAGAR